MPYWAQIPPVRESAGSGWRRTAVAVVVPLAAAALLWRSRHARAAAALLAVAAALVVVGALSPRARRAIDAALGVFGAAVGRALSAVALTALFVFVMAPIGLWLRLVGRDPLSSEPDASRASYWERVVKHPRRPLFDRQFVYEPRRADGDKRLPAPLRWFAIVSVLLVVNTLAGVALRAIHRPPEVREIVVTDEASWDYAAAWKRQYQAEIDQLEYRFEPFVGWLHKDFAGAFVNVQGGVRRTYRAADAANASALEVWFLGGSTAWGHGSRDLHTIPSEFAAIAERHQVPMRVTNYAESAFDAWQELVRFETLIASGRKPDVVIMYDGINEVGVQLERPSTRPMHYSVDWMTQLNNRAGDWRHLVRALRTNSGLTYLYKLAFGKRRWDALEGPEPASPDVATNAASLHTAALRIMYGICEREGIALVPFWQPSIYTKRALSAGDAHVLSHFPQQASARAAYLAVRPLIDRRVHDISDALDGIDGSIFIDEMHINELGNRVVAERIFAEAEPTLRAALAKKQRPSAVAP